jgi:hypothetical protein
MESSMNTHNLHIAYNMMVRYKLKAINDHQKMSDAENLTVD